MAIDDLMVRDGSQDFYDESFKATIEAHFPYLKSSRRTTTQVVSIHQGVVYAKDLYGLLTEMKIKPCYHWVIMRLNDFLSPRDFTSDTASLLMPAESELESLRQSWRTSQRINA